MSERRQVRKRPRVERLAVEFLEVVRELERSVLRHAPDLNPDLQECAASILANFGEGWDESSLGDKRRFFRYAHRSAGEAERLLRAFRALPRTPTAATDRALSLLFAIKMDLRRLLRSV